MDKNKELAELLGICWHDWMNVQDGTICTICHRYSYNLGSNPDFTTDAGKVQLLREMEKKEGWAEFLETIGTSHGMFQAESTDPLVYCPNRVGVYGVELMHISLMTDTTGLLRDRAIEFMRGRKK